MISSITVNELSKIKGAKIIDLRITEKYNDNHIPGSSNVTFEKLIIEPKRYLNFTDTYYIYCQKGTKSVQACMYLQKQGFKVVNIKGGYESWIIEN